MDDGSITLLAALIILVAFSAFFSASETAFSSLNQIRLKSRAEDGDSDKYMIPCPYVLRMKVLC